jgi:hypothetical protein
MVATKEAKAPWRGHPLSSRAWLDAGGLQVGASQCSRERSAMAASLSMALDARESSVNQGTSAINVARSVAYRSAAEMKPNSAKAIARCGNDTPARDRRDRRSTGTAMAGDRLACRRPDATLGEPGRNWMPEPLPTGVSHGASDRRSRHQAWNVHAVCPPHELPAPAVQPKQWRAVTMGRRCQLASSYFEMCGPSGNAISRSSI